jgi:hypothetical protein
MREGKFEAVADLDMGKFDAVADLDMPKGWAAIVRDGRIVMMGPVGDMHVEAGDTLVLSPDDFITLEDHMKQQLN